MQQYIPLVVGQHHRDCVVPLYDAEKEIDVLLGSLPVVAPQIGNLLCGVGPYLHPLPLLNGKIINNIIRHIKEKGNQRQRYDKERHHPETSYFIDIHLHQRQSLWSDNQGQPLA